MCYPLRQKPWRIAVYIKPKTIVFFCCCHGKWRENAKITVVEAGSTRSTWRLCSYPPQRRSRSSYSPISNTRTLRTFDTKSSET